jgi:hypothetical protein
MNKKQLAKFKKHAIAEMPLRDAEKKHIADGNYLHQIHFDKVPESRKQKEIWLKKELINYFGLRGFLRGEPGLESPLITDKEFGDMLLLFQLPSIWKMKKEIEELQDVWRNECDKKHCPIIDYLLHQESTE